MVLVLKSQQPISEQLVLLIELNLTHSHLISRLTFLSLILIILSSPRLMHSRIEFISKNVHSLFLAKRVAEKLNSLTKHFKNINETLFHVNRFKMNEKNYSEKTGE